jgi:hypothetical protein
VVTTAVFLARNRGFVVALGVFALPHFIFVRINANLCG